MSKYRVEFKPSRLLLVLQCLTYVGLVLSVVYWQSNIILNQVLLQTLVISIISYFLFRAVLSNYRRKLSPVTFSLLGDWLETSKHKQVAWEITDKSRVSSLLLFVHLISPVNCRRSKWCLIYRDQVTERDFRRLSRAVIYQQQIAGKD
ncbi:protein YgfX [uncultured Paraglaciecola sp.]|uniref:protein YgfX n=1 Tax=uncultured Paraglaciecola sp. TaxID=1765024 RepID=UPI0025FFAD46|nr:protein YgfX [uncultured Paraglaciecola sp.]